MKKLYFKYFWIALFSSITIGLLSFLNSKFDYGLFLIGSFGASVVLIFGFPSSPFSKKKNIFFGHFLTSLAGIIVLKYLPFSVMTLIPIAVGLGIFMMLLFNVAHPPAGGNAIILILGEHSYNFLLNPIILGTIILIVMSMFYNFISDSKVISEFSGKNEDPIKKIEELSKLMDKGIITVEEFEKSKKKLLDSI